MVSRQVKASLAALAALIFAAVLVAIGVGLLSRLANADRFPWRDYSPEELTQLRRERRPILIHFVADWDFSVHVIRRAVIETAEVRDAVDRNGFIPFLADCSTRESEAWKLLQSLDINQLPVTMVIPPDEKRSVVLIGGFTKERLIAALNGEG